jgi:hypothetical protein
MLRLKPALLFVAALAALAFGQRAVVFDFEIVSAEPELATTVSVLLKDRLGDQGFVVVEPPAGAVARTVDEAAAQARPLGADKAVIGSVTRLGSRYIISYKLVDVGTGTVEFGDRANVGSADELDMATERIARAIRERRPFAQTGEVGKVTEAERRRTAALSSFILTTGYAFPLDHRIPADPGNMLFTLDAAITYETPDVLAQGVMGIRRGKNSYSEIFFDLLVHKMFSRLDVSPYVGAGVGVHKLSIQLPGNWEDREDDGLALIASGGLVLFRTQYFRIVGGLKAGAILTEDFGAVSYGSFNFGLSSPTFGPGGGVDMPTPCIYGALGVFFLTGLIVALTT